MYKSQTQNNFQGYFAFVIAQVSPLIAIFFRYYCALKGQSLIYFTHSSYKIFKAKATVTMFSLLVVLKI